jgi:hypothetical protein
MTDLTFDPAALRALLARAHDEISNIAEGKRRWTMSIPAKPETDSDLLISEALSGAEKALDALAAAREELAEMRRKRNDAIQKRAKLIQGVMTVRCWTNEDGKQFVFADDLFALLDPPANAVPAAAPQADEPKARTYRDMPVVNCGTDLSHMAHVYPVNGEKVVCAGLLPHSIVPCGEATHSHCNDVHCECGCHEDQRFDPFARRWVAAVPGDGEQAATTCTCPPKTNNQKDPTIMQVEFTPAYLLGAWQEDPDCPQHGDAALPTSRQA